MISASFVVGENWPVSMELMVFRDTPTSSARAAWESFRSVRASLMRFLRISWSFMAYHQPSVAFRNPRIAKTAVREKKTVKNQ